MDEILLPCWFCGTHWPESHLTRATVYDGRWSGPLRENVCCVCVDDQKIDDPHTDLERKREILRIRNALLEKRRHRRDGPDAVAEWTPDLDPPRG